VARGPHAHGHGPLLAGEPARLLRRRKAGRSRGAGLGGASPHGAPWGERQPHRLLVQRGARQSPQPSPPLSQRWGLSRHFWGLAHAARVLGVVYSTRDARGGVWEARAEPARGWQRRGLCRDAPCGLGHGEGSAPSCGTARGAPQLPAFGCSRLHPASHADPRPLPPSMAQRWALGRGASFPHGGSAGRSGVPGMLPASCIPPPPRGAPARPSLLRPCLPRRERPFYLLGGYKWSCQMRSAPRYDRLREPGPLEQSSLVCQSRLTLPIMARWMRL